MAIQNRRGAYENFDPAKLLSGEWATVLSGDPNARDGRATYQCFEPGVVKRMATYEDMQENVDHSLDDMKTQFLSGITEATARAEEKAEAADTAAQNAQGITDLVTQKLQDGDFIGPQGEKGETGEKGEKGDPGEVTNLPEQTVAFTEAETDSNIASGDSLKVMFGKLLKTIKSFRTKHASIDISISGIESTLSEHTAALSETTPVSRGGTGETVRYESVTLTRNTANTPVASSYACRYYPYLKMCFARIYIAPRASLTYKAGETYVLYTIPEGYRGNAIHAGNCYLGGTSCVKVRVNSAGEITIVPDADITTGWAVYITIYWLL